MPVLDLTGHRFGSLTAVRRLDGPSAWRCRCDCGRERDVPTKSLRRGQVTTCGAAHHRWQGPTLSYVGAHRRVVRARGRAKDQTCPCGAPAHEWSYDGDDPEELRGPPRAGANPLPYSLDPDRYTARCRPCHRRLDKAGQHPKRRPMAEALAPHVPTERRVCAQHGEQDFRLHRAGMRNGKPRYHRRCPMCPQRPR